MKTNQYKVYVILCENGSLYTGISTDVERRFKEHKSGKGARFFRSTKPERVVWNSTPETHRNALVMERLLKSFSKEGKIRFLEKMGVVLDKV